MPLTVARSMTGIKTAKLLLFLDSGQWKIYGVCFPSSAL